MPTTAKWDKRMEPLMKLVLHKKGVTARSAAEVGKKVVTIFRGKDFVEFLTNSANFDTISRRCPEAVAAVAGKGASALTVDEAKKLGSELIQRGFIARAVAKVLKVAPADQGGDASKDEKESNDGKDGKEGKKKKTKKWPEKVIRLPQAEQEFEPAGSFFIVLYEGSKTVQHIISVLAIVLVLVLCMFPAWPVWAKIAVWYLVFWFSSSMLVLLVVRMILYVCLWTVGVDFWLFPNLLDEYAGVVDSFKPWYSLERRKDGYGMTGIRLVSMVVLALATYEFAQHNSWDDIKNFARNSINDILEWGTDKLTALPQAKTQYLSLADIEKMTETDGAAAKPTTIPADTVVIETEEEEALFEEMQEF